MEGPDGGCYSLDLREEEKGQRRQGRQTKNSLSVVICKLRWEEGGEGQKSPKLAKSSFGAQSVCSLQKEKNFPISRADCPTNY